MAPDYSIIALSDISMLPSHATNSHLSEISRTAKVSFYFVNFVKMWAKKPFDFAHTNQLPYVMLCVYFDISTQIRPKWPRFPTNKTSLELLCSSSIEWLVIFSFWLSINMVKAIIHQQTKQFPCHMFLFNLLSHSLIFSDLTSGTVLVTVHKMFSWQISHQSSASLNYLTRKSNTAGCWDGFSITSKSCSIWSVCIHIRWPLPQNHQMTNCIFCVAEKPTRG